MSYQTKPSYLNYYFPFLPYERIYETSLNNSTTQLKRCFGRNALKEFLVSDVVNLHRVPLEEVWSKWRTFTFCSKFHDCGHTELQGAFLISGWNLQCKWSMMIRGICCLDFFSCGEEVYNTCGSLRTWKCSYWFYLCFGREKEQEREEQLMEDKKRKKEDKKKKESAQKVGVDVWVLLSN